MGFLGLALFTVAMRESASVGRRYASRGLSSRDALGPNRPPLQGDLRNENRIFQRVVSVQVSTRSIRDGLEAAL